MASNQEEVSQPYDLQDHLPITATMIYLVTELGMHATMLYLVQRQLCL